MAKPLRRLVQLILDRGSAKDVERTAQRALDRGTDPDRAKRNLREVEGAFGKLKRGALALGGVLAGIWGVRQVFEYGKAVFNVGAAVGAVKSQFEAVFGVIGAGLEASLDQWRMMAGLSRTALREQLAGLGAMGQGLGMSVEESARFAEQVLRLSGDLASFNGGMFTTASAARLVTSALIGNTEATRALKVSFTALDVQHRALANTGKSAVSQLTQEERVLAGLQVIAERAGPMIGDLNRTQEEADNRAKQLAGSWDQLKETWAAAIVTGGTSGDVLGDLTVFLRDLTAATDANRNAISKWARVVVSGVIALAKTIAFPIRALSNVGEIVGEMGILLLASLKALVLGTINEIAFGANFLIDQLNRLPGVEIDFRFGQFDITDAVKAMEFAAFDITKDLKDIGSAALGVAEAWKRVHEHATSAAIAQQQAAGAGGGGGGGGGGPSFGTPTVGITDIAMPTPGIVAGPIDFERQQSQWDRLFGAIGIGAQDVSRILESQFASAFSMMSDESASAEERFGAMFAALGQGAQAALVQIAGAKVAENLALAVEEGARGFGALATGNVAGAGLHFQAAAEHVAAAAAWGTLGAFVGGVGGARGGGGGGVPGGSRVATEAGTRDPSEPDINIWVDGIDPDNPTHQRLTHAAAERGGQRYRIRYRQGGARGAPR